MAILETKSQKVKKPKDYQSTKFKLKLDEINIIDKMDFHRKIGEMIFRDLLQTTTSMGRILKMENKDENKWKQEKGVTRTKKIRIN